MLFRVLILLIFVSISSSSHAQLIRVLNLKTEKYYSEQNIFRLRSPTTLIQEVCYNKPNTIDEEYCLSLEIVIVDTSKAIKQRRFDINKDTSVIKCVFDSRSVWNWEEEKTTITGEINILSWTMNSIELSLDITIIDNRKNRTYLYKGKRAYIEKKSSVEHEWSKL